jgi:hypothetical protein
VSSSWLAGCIRRHPSGRDGKDPASLWSRWGSPDGPDEAAGERHPLPSPVSVMVAGVASGHGEALTAAQAAGWDQDVLAGYGCRIGPQTRGARPAVGLDAGPAPEATDALRSGQLRSPPEYTLGGTRCSTVAAFSNRLQSGRLRVSRSTSRMITTSISLCSISLNVEYPSSLSRATIRHPRRSACLSALASWVGSDSASS